MPSNAPCDPGIHQAARLIARQFAAMMAGVLRDEERGEAEREGYRIAREAIEQFQASGGVPLPSAPPGEP